MDNNDQLTGLRSIHDLLVDSREGYLEACNRAEDRRKKELLPSFSRERIALESELMAEVRRLDPTVAESSGMAKMDLLRAWKDIRSALIDSDDANVLAESERSEGYLLTRYDELLADNHLDPTTHALLTKQRAQVQGNLSIVRGQHKAAQALTL